MFKKLNEIRKHIMSYEEYRKKKTSAPYFFKIEKKDQILYYFGSNHSYDPNNEQYLALKKHWREFSAKTKPENSLVLVEGGVRPVAKNAIEAISIGAEANLITYLANKKGYKTYSPEPGRVAETKALLSKYTKEQIQYFYFAQIVHQWGNLIDKPNFREYVYRFLKYDKEITGWKGFDFTINNMKRIHQELFNGEFDEIHTNFFGSITNPLFGTTIINQFVQDQNIERDVLIIKKILENWKEGNNLFIVFGYTHVVMQEPALKKLT